MMYRCLSAQTFYPGTMLCCMAAEKGHAKIISLPTDAGAQLEAKADLDVSAWLVVGDCIVHTHRRPYMESISSLSIAEMISFISINYQRVW